ncbi:hypothetical protein MMC07_000421 [Pseudocyphellaria aurata]|nr:hypothetical protein [Pseudocyphellaria aurata]
MELEEAALRLIHNSYATVAELVDRVYAEYRPGKENADVEGQTSPRQKHPMTRPLIRSWLWHVGDNLQLEGRNTFKAKQQFVKQYNLNMPPDKPLDKAKLAGDLHMPGEASAGEAKPAGNGHAKPARRSRITNPNRAPPNSIECSICLHVTWHVHDQEDEARLQKMPDKLVAFNILKDKGKEGMRVADLVAAIKAIPQHADWDNKKTLYLRNALKSDHAFTRIEMGIFALRSIAGSVDWAEPTPEAGETAPGKRKMDGQLQLADMVLASAPSVAGSDSSRPAKAAKTSSGKAVCIDKAAFEDPAAKFAEMVQRMSEQGSDGEKV